MTEERSKRRELLPFIFVVKCFKKRFEVSSLIL